jgi:hypothetical protein
LFNQVQRVAYRIGEEQEWHHWTSSELQSTMQAVIGQRDGRLRAERAAYRDQFAALDVRVDGKVIEIAPMEILDDEDAEVDLRVERYGDG